MPKKYKKVLVIGSGPIIIGQAAEFDYAGTQACLALKEEGIEVILINNNPATIMTDENIIDKVYFEPLTVETVTKVIAKERPDGLLATLGGQIGLNLAIALDEAKVLEKYQVELLGSPITAIKNGEDRELFKQKMAEINEPVPESITTNQVNDALKFAEKVGYPVIVRPAYTLGGTGGGAVYDEKELQIIATQGINVSPIGQIQVDKSLIGWREIEYEVMRDKRGNSIIVCNMENIDPMGIHTGDSIVIAPSQTLNDREYQMLRDVSLKVIDALEIVGGCNIQFALAPKGDQYYIIEVNPRVSRSSALASKATGYPIARITTKLALGFLLHEIKNPITKNTYASFEPALDYVVLKIPRFPFDKFPYLNRTLGTQMKATGEVMAIDRTFTGALWKGIRSLEIGKFSLTSSDFVSWSDQQLEKGLKNGDDRRLFLLAESIRRGMSIQKIYQLTKIHPFFLTKIKQMVDIEENLRGRKFTDLTKEEWKELKRQGVANRFLAEVFNKPLIEIQRKLNDFGITTVYKAVDTCAGEFAAETPYFYGVQSGKDEKKSLTGKKIVILGSGPIRIGQGIEFDYCAVHTSLSLQQTGFKAIMINNNPETVSTDYQMSDRLYMEPLTVEDVLPILEQEEVTGIIYQVGGQTALKLAKELNRILANKKLLLGTSLEVVEEMEDRSLFNHFLQNIGIEPIKGVIINDSADIANGIKQLGFPVLVRPSYVIGGQWMRKINNQEELANYLQELALELRDNTIYPLLMDKFIEGKEVEVDVVTDGSDYLVPILMEHLEPAGIHSGDSTAILPSFSIDAKVKRELINIVEKIVATGKFQGLLNIQFIIAEKKIYVLEINPRASRTLPIISKVTGIPLINLATKVQLGEKLSNLGYKTGFLADLPYFAVKAPIFSNQKLDLSMELGPEMKSTGEIIALGFTIKEARERIKGNVEEEVRSLQEYHSLFLKQNLLEKEGAKV